MKKQIFSLCLSVVLVAGVFTGCGGAEDTAALDVVLMGPYVNEEAVGQYSAQLKEKENGTEAAFITLATGDSTVDAMAHGAGVIKFSAMVAAKEVDVVICDLENAARSARGGAFMPLADYLTEEEIAALGARALDFDQVDDAGNPTGERSAVCGVRLQGGEAQQAIFGNQEIGIFLAGNTEQTEEGARVVRYAMDKA